MRKKQRNYRHEYDTYQGKPAQIKNRASRNKARRKMEDVGRAHKGDGMDVDHEDGNPQNNSRDNLRITTKAKNRSRKKYI